MENDISTPIDFLKKKAGYFVKERDWEKYHNPKDLAIAISVESSELLDIFKWRETLKDPKKIPAKIRNEITEEMADVLIYLLSLSNVMSVDLTKAVLRKMKRNATKYPKETPTSW